MADCSVCAEAFNKTKRKQVVCPYCSVCACLACHRTYLLGTVEAMHCMSCRTAWSLNLSHMLFPDAFWKEYYVRRASLTLAQEKVRLPETMNQMRKEYLVKQMFNCSSNIELCGRRMVTGIENMHREEHVHLVINNLLQNLKMHIRNYEEHKIEYDQIVYPASRQTNTTDNVEGIDNAGGDHGDLSEIDVGMYLPCPYTNCRGFTNHRGRCALCEKMSCLKCRHEKTENHQCKAEDVESVALIKKDCRPCPKCRAYIYRTEGCTQMFCTHCHAQFDWNTGKILTKIHNPHLTEWLQGHGHHQVGEGLGCEPVVHLYAFPERVQWRVRLFYDRALHLSRFEIPRLRAKHADVKEQLRRKYLQSALTESMWVNELRLHLIRVERTQEIVQLLELFHDVTMRILVATASKTMDWFSESEKLLEEMTTDINNKLDILSHRYKIKTLSYRWRFPKDPLEYGYHYV